MRKVSGLPSGASLGKVLEDLELCGFVRKTEDFSQRVNGRRYQLVDLYSRFHLEFMQRRRFDSWVSHSGTPSYRAWRGTTFELVCALHAEQIKNARGIAGVETRTCSWRSKASDPGAQIDLVIDRSDNMVDLCEAKFTDGEFSITKADNLNIANKRDAFMAETGTRKSLQTVLVSVNGLKRNKYYHVVNAVVSGDDLFARR